MDITPTKDADKKFDFSGIRNGGFFLGCTRCWWQSPPNVGMKPECPECGEHLHSFQVHKVADDHHSKKLNLMNERAVNEIVRQNLNKGET